MADVSIPSLATVAPVTGDSIPLARLATGLVDRRTTVDALKTFIGSGGTVPGMVIPTAGGGSAAIQAAITSLTTANTPGVVWLGNATWVCATGITFDPTMISLQGAGATLDFSTAGDIDFITATEVASGNYKAQLRQSMQNIRIIGAGQATGRAIVWKTLTGSDFSSGGSVRNVVIESVKIAMFWGDNGYITRCYDVSVKNAAVAFQRDTFVNNGEALSFYGCLVFNGGRVFQFNGSNMDAYFFGGSFDYNTKIGYSDTTVEFHAVHMESSSTQTANIIQFECDNSGVMKFFGGNISLVTNTGTAAANLFAAYPSNIGGRFELRGVAVDTFHGNQWGTAMVGTFGSTKQRLLIDNGSSNARSISAPYTISPLDSGSTIEVTGAQTVTVPINMPSGMKINFVPNGGAVTIVSSGGALLNGTTTALVRTTPFEIKASVLALDSFSVTGGFGGIGVTATVTGALPLTALGSVTTVNAASATVQTLPDAASAWAQQPFGLVVLSQKGAGAPTFAAAGTDSLRATSGIAASVQYGMIAAQIISPTEWALA